MRAEFESLVANAKSFVNAANKQSTGRRRIQCRKKQAMIAPRRRSSDGPRSKASDAVGDQPFALFGLSKIRTNFRAERNG
jgi:hypothetical protein